MTTPTDGIEGTQGKLFYWTRQGISLADFQRRVEEALALIEAAGGIVGITQLGIDLVTAETQAEARAVIDAASTADIGSGGGGGTIGLPIEIADVNNLTSELSQRSLTGHHHVASQIDGLSAEAAGILGATNHAEVVAAIDLAAGELADITDVGVSTLTASGADTAARQTASRAALDAAKQSHLHTVADVDTLGAQLSAINADLATTVDQAYVDANTAWAHGIQPRVVWNGVAWPARSTVLPVGYTGGVEYWSAYDSSAPSPTDRLGDGGPDSDIWTQRQPV